MRSYQDGLVLLTYTNAPAATATTHEDDEHLPHGASSCMTDATKLSSSSSEPVFLYA